MKKKIRELFCLVALMCCALGIRAQRISGTVVDSLGNPIPKVFVTEIDKNYRIVSSTTTNAAGKFTMKISDNELVHLRVSASGYRTITQRQVPQQGITITLTPKGPSWMEKLLSERPSMKRKYVLTSKLLCGRMGGRQVPWLVMLEHLGDSIFVLRLPVKVDTQMDTYPEGRMAVIEGYDQKQSVQMYNAEDVYAVQGPPNDRETWKPICRLDYGQIMRHEFVESVFEDEGFFYPSFIVTRRELQSLLDNPDSFARLLIDNQRANNYWIMYPLSTFEKELQQILDKFGEAK